MKLVNIKTYYQLVVLSFLGLSLLISCASKNRKAHQKYLSEVSLQKQQLGPVRYQGYIKKQLERKRLELMQIKAQIGQEADRYRDNEAHDNPTNSFASVSRHGLMTREINYNNLKKSKQRIEKEIFFLESQYQIPSK